MSSAIFSNSVHILQFCRGDATWMRKEAKMRVMKASSSFSYYCMLVGDHFEVNWLLLSCGIKQCEARTKPGPGFYVLTSH